MTSQFSKTRWQAVFRIIWYGSGSSILGWIHRSGFSPDPGFWWPKIENFTAKKKFQTTEEAFSPQKRTSSTSKQEISYFFYFCG
jgi:hypothetical protein